MKYTDNERRLGAILGFINNAQTLADVGTDHAYLPIRALREGRAVRAVASDINPLPLEKAKRNIAKAGLEDRIGTVLADGLSGLGGFSPDVIVIAGMGGELITSIMENGARSFRGATFILQPNTHEHDLRRFLYSNGFDVRDERVVEDKEKFYQIIVAAYDGKTREASLPELILGRVNIEKNGFPDGYLEKVRARFSRRVSGLCRAGKESPEDSEVLSFVETLIKEGKNNDRKTTV